ncbi:MAG TPA: hypothetical protein PLZ51_29605, partial [Aggregatilineales bacterium]|nr:hypothetical protein [Aggregatilineales bacterium]
MNTLIPQNLPQWMGRKGAICCALTIMMGVLTLTACDTIIPRNPTEVPTWEYTAPTLAPTEVFYA